jgi:hypothetical protein
MFINFRAIRSLPFERDALMALFEASRHSDCADPAHFGHPADPFRTAVQTISDSHPTGPKNCPTIHRIAVRIKSAARPN